MQLDFLKVTEWVRCLVEKLSCTEKRSLKWPGYRLPLLFLSVCASLQIQQIFLKIYLRLLESQLLREAERE